MLIVYLMLESVFLFGNFNEDLVSIVVLVDSEFPVLMIFLKCPLEIGAMIK